MTRRLVASFLEYALVGKCEPDEVRRFTNATYDDPEMAAAIAELQTHIPHTAWCSGRGSLIGQPFEQEAADRIYEIVRRLRQEPLKKSN
jgi:hypothetical protein